MFLQQARNKIEDKDSETTKTLYFTMFLACRVRKLAFRKVPKTSLFTVFCTPTEDKTTLFTTFSDRKRTPATQKTAAPHQSYFVGRASADIYGGTESATPAENATPATRKTAAPHQSYFVAKLPLTSMVVQKVQRLPRKSSPRYGKCHACHAKDRGATSVLLRRRASADIYGGTESTTPATQNEPEVPKAPRLPRKRLRRHISPTSSPSFR